MLYYVLSHHNTVKEDRRCHNHSISLYFFSFNKIKLQKTISANKYEYVQNVYNVLLDNTLLLLMGALVEDKGHGSVPA